MAQHVTVLDTISGQVGSVPVSYLKHPAFKDHLVEVPEGTKSYDSEFYQPTDAAGHKEKPVQKAKAKAPAIIEGELDPTLDIHFE